MYSSLLQDKSSHKAVDPSSFWLLRAYYKHRLVMGVCCVSAELLYLALYLAHWPAWATPGLPLPPALVAHFLPPRSPARLNALAVGLLRAGRGGALGTLRLPFTSVLAALALPGWLLKQVANVVQLKTSMDACIAFDQRKAAPKKE